MSAVRPAASADSITSAVPSLSLIRAPPLRERSSQSVAAKSRSRETRVRYGAVSVLLVGLRQR